MPRRSAYAVLAERKGPGTPGGGQASSRNEGPTEGHFVVESCRPPVERFPSNREKCLNRLSHPRTPLTTDQRRRRNVAIGLKVISVLSGIVIATGFLTKSIVQVLGGVIPAITALERVFANLSHLLAVTAAKNAYERVRRQTVARHNQQIVEVVRIRDTDPAKAADTLIAFVGALRDQLAATTDEIEGRLAQDDYDSLGRLSLEDDAHN